MIEQMTLMILKLLMDFLVIMDQNGFGFMPILLEDFTSLIKKEKIIKSIYILLIY